VSDVVLPLKSELSKLVVAVGDWADVGTRPWHRRRKSTGWRRGRSYGGCCPNCSRIPG